MRISRRYTSLQQLAYSVQTIASRKYSFLSSAVSLAVSSFDVLISPTAFAHRLIDLKFSLISIAKLRSRLYSCKTGSLQFGGSRANRSFFQRHNSMIHLWTKVKVVIKPCTQFRYKFNGRVVFEINFVFKSHRRHPAFLTFQFTYHGSCQTQV